MDSSLQLGSTSWLSTKTKLPRGLQINHYETNRDVDDLPRTPTRKPIRQGIRLPRKQIMRCRGFEMLWGSTVVVCNYWRIMGRRPLEGPRLPLSSLPMRNYELPRFRYFPSTNPNSTVSELCMNVAPAITMGAEERLHPKGSRMTREDGAAVRFDVAIGRIRPAPWLLRNL